MEELPTTFLCAVKRASWSLPFSLRALNGTHGLQNRWMVSTRRTEVAPMKEFRKLEIGVLAVLTMREGLKRRIFMALGQ